MSQIYFVMFICSCLS